MIELLKIEVEGFVFEVCFVGFVGLRIRGT